MMREAIRRQAVMEKSVLEGLMSSLSEEDRLERMAAEMRLRALEKKILHFSTRSESVIRAQTLVTFNGGPVVRNSAIYADFAGKALSSFQELVSSFMSGLVRQAKKGDKYFPKTFSPLPLAIVGVAHGSFGFELKEIDESSDNTTHLLGNTLLTEALHKALEVFQASQRSPAEFMESAKGLEARSINALAEFLNEVHSSHATFRITTEQGPDLSFDDDSVSRAFANATAAIQETSREHFQGVLSGVFINSRKFEFIIDGRRTLIGGLGSEVDAHSLMPFLETACEIVLVVERAVRAGKRRPKDRLTLVSIQSADTNRQE